jgi:hypothetical protein
MPINLEIVAIKTIFEDHTMTPMCSFLIYFPNPQHPKSGYMWTPVSTGLHLLIFQEIHRFKEENSTQISFIFSSSGKINSGSPSWHRCPSSPYPEMLASELPHNISGGKVNSA